MNKGTVTVGVVLVGVGITMIAVGMRPTGGGGGGGGDGAPVDPGPGGEEAAVDQPSQVLDDAGSATGDTVPDDVAGVLGLANEGVSFG